MGFKLWKQARSYTYEEMYPPVDVLSLRDYYNRNSAKVDQIREHFISVRETINPLPEVPSAISVSLFRAGRDNRHPKQYPIAGKRSDEWLRKYYSRFLDNIEWFPQGFDTRHWKLVVYLCPESLGALLPAINVLDTLRQHEFIEINIMRFPSVGHGPGASWRFLSMGDQKLDRLLVYDIDEPWSDNVNTWFREAYQYDKPFTRAHHMPREGFWLSPKTPWYLNNSGTAINYATILASKQLVYPRRFGLPDIDILIAAYVALRMERAKSRNPLSQLTDGEARTPYNRPMRAHKFGWGNHWYQYCFDERFLKHVVFPYAVRNGLLCTYCLPQFVTSDLQSYLAQPKLRDFLADFKYTQTNPNNIIVNNNDVYRESLV